MQPALAIAAVVGFISLAGGAESEAELVASDASLAEIMETIVMPAADVLWTAVAVDVTAAGVVYTAPETEEDWQRIRNSAVSLAATTDKLLNENLPVSNAEPVEPPPGELDPQQIASLRKENWEDWVAHVLVLHEVAESALKMIDAKDTEGLSEVGGSLDEACESCHLQFWYPEG
jgi:Fe-S cluster biosynthesis and repair protein YggX